MSLLKRYGKWFLKPNIVRNDLADFLGSVIWCVLVLYGIKYLNKYPFWTVLLLILLAVSCSLLFTGLLRKSLGKFNIEIPKWVGAMPIAVSVFYIFIRG